MHRSIFHSLKRPVLSGAVILLGAFSLLSAPETASAATGTAKIHVLTLPGNTTAVLLESKDKYGQKVFGMVDSGEDWDYPDGSDERYPKRSGIITNEGYDQEVLDYLDSVGVTSYNLEFYVATHPHSDHIGTADTIIRNYSPERVYLLDYQDSYISDETRLWDNLYVYDQTVQAASETSGVTLISHLDPNASSAENGNPSFSLGYFDIQIVNYDEDFLTKPKEDVNQFCLGVIATANNHRAFLSSDIDNTEKNGSTPGDLDKILADYNLSDIDLVTANHHGYDNAMDTDYLKSISADYFVQPGYFRLLQEDKISLLSQMNSRIFSTTAYTDSVSAIIVDFSASNVTSNVDDTYIIYENYSSELCAYYDGLPYHGFFTLNGDKYYSDEDGILLRNTNWLDTSTNTEYTFDEDGRIISEKTPLGWEKKDGKWYYPYSDGTYHTGWLSYDGSLYYLDEDGVMATGWYEIDDNWYLFADWGGMLTGWQKYDNEWYYLDTDTGIMYHSGWHPDPRDGTMYYFYSWGGIAKSKTLTLSGHQIRFLSWGGVSGEAFIRMNNNWYLVRNYVCVQGSGWQKVSGEWYYLNDNDTLKTSESFLYDGSRYFVNDSGKMYHDQWIDWNDNLYYVTSWGGALTNQWFQFQSKWYFLNEDGTMKRKESFLYDENLYFVNDSGVMYSDQWVHWDEDWYYVKSWGGAMRNEWLHTKDGKWYYLDDDCTMVTGWKTINGKTYYFDEDGARVTGTQTIDGVTYTFDRNGVLTEQE